MVCVITGSKNQKPWIAKKKKKFSPVWTRTASKINRWGHCIERDSIDVFRLSKTYSTCSCTDLIHFQIHRCYWESQAILRRSKYRSISKIKKFLTVKILESKTIMGLLQTIATVILRWMFQRFSKFQTDTEIFRVAPFFHFSPCIKWSQWLKSKEIKSAKKVRENSVSVISTIIDSKNHSATNPRDEQVTYAENTTKMKEFNTASLCIETLDR